MGVRVVQLLPPADYLRERLTYDPATGALTWRSRSRDHFTNARIWTAWNARFSGAAAGCVNGDGYWLVSLDHRHHRAHRVIWKMVTGEEPPDQIDHVDRNRANNRWDNLRPALQSEQNWNSGERANDTGRRGVYQYDRKRPWAQMSINGVTRRIGRFDTVEQASAAYEAAARELHGEFYRVGG